MNLTTINPDALDVPDSTWRDSLGIVASVGCAIHCAAMPFVIAYLPALGLSFLADESFHKWMALICFLIAIVAFIPGIRKHGNWIPVSIGAVGLAMITFAAFGLAGECCPSCESGASMTATTTANSTTAMANGEPDSGCDCASCAASEEATEPSVASATEQKKDWLTRLAPWLTPIGGLALVSGHLLNRRYGCLCGCC
ncbi:MerC domain-containing protein [Mariniblastus fucicola]|uniref:MerC mercury resistance protein n=1 Tax=Mariniblastus fucicola TaxID=980251 RepID=A0A5B9PBU5_9BACT|nr:MerC domain-containing protein [Mariniblastus fucicola]QEG22645.1 MerC mercury resistance protein [Mariniblastus fucicola]